MTAGAGIIKSRDFVNLRCWRLCRNGRIQSSDASEDVGPPSFAMPSLASTYTEPVPTSFGGETGGVAAASTTRATVHRDADDRLIDFVPGTPSLTASSAHQRIENDVQRSAAAVATPPRTISSATSSGEDADASVRSSGLNRSLGASGFFDASDMHSGDEDEFADAEGNASGMMATPSHSGSLVGGGGAGAEAEFSSNNVYVSAAISLAYDKMPTIPKYTRAENRLSCWAMREINGKPDACIFEWLMCIDLKGYVPTSILNKVCNRARNNGFTELI